MSQSETEATIEFQVGKLYKTRDGRVAWVYGLGVGSYPIVGLITMPDSYGRGRRGTWTLSGRYVHELGHECDLVAEYDGPFPFPLPDMRPIPADLGFTVILQYPDGNGTYQDWSPAATWQEAVAEVAASMAADESIETLQEVKVVDVLVGRTSTAPGFTPGSAVDVSRPPKQPALTVETGKLYKTRGGFIAWVVTYDADADNAYPFGGLVASATGDCVRRAEWSEDGVWTLHDGPHEFDLIEEYHGEFPVAPPSSKTQTGPGQAPAEPGTSAEPMEPEAGKRYVTRDGRITTCLDLLPGDAPNYPFRGAVISDTPPGVARKSTWQPDGRYIGDSEHPLDLVAEYKEGDVPTWKLEAGKRYVTRDGRITTCLAIIPGSGLNYPLIGTVDDVLRTWTAVGRYDVNHVDHPFDLVAEYEEDADV